VSTAAAAPVKDIPTGAPGNLPAAQPAAAARPLGARRDGATRTTGDGLMEKVFRIDTVLTGDLAELYAVVMAEFQARSDIPLAEVNRALLQTGMLHHLAMMAGLGLVSPEHAAAIDSLVDKVGRTSIMGDVVQLARQYWRNCAAGGVQSGGGGSDPQARE